MAQVAEKLIITVDVKDSAKAKKALKGLEAGFKQTGKAGKDAFFNIRQQSKGLRRDLGALRNNLLVVAFATEGVRRAFKGFLDARGSLQKFEAQLRSFSGSSEIASRQLNTFIDLAAKTPFTVEDIVQGGVQLEAFGARAEPLIPTIANLAALMNRSIPEAANAFGRAFAGGRGAADVFRETGILAIIDDFESLDETLNKEKLSLEEFRIKMIQALSDPDGRVANGIKELEGTLFQAFANMEDSVFMFKARVGEELEPLFLNFANNMTKFFNAMDTDRIRDFGAVLKVAFISAVGLAIQSMILWSASIIKASMDMALLQTMVVSTTVSFTALNQTIKRNAIVLFITTVAAAVAILDRLKNRVNEVDDGVADQALTIEEYIAELKGLAKEDAFAKQEKSVAENIIKLEEQLAVLSATNAVDKEQAKLVRDLTHEERSLIKQIEKKKEALKEITRIDRERETFLKTMVKTEQENLIAAEAKTNASISLSKLDTSNFEMNEKRKAAILSEVFIKEESLRQLFYQKGLELNRVKLLDEDKREAARLAITVKYARLREAVEKESAENIQAMLDGFKENDVSTKEEELSTIRNFNLLVEDSYFNMYSNIQQQFAKVVKANMDQEIRALKKTDKFRNASQEQREDMENDIKEKFADQQRLSFMAQQALQIAQVVMTFQRAKFEIEAAAAAAFAAGDKGAILKGEALIKGLKISSAIQSGLIAAQKPPAFARGGSFVTDGPQQILVGDNPGGRERVDVSPLSSPNFDGPGGSEVTVNIMGNVIGTEEFVRDTLIPELDNSIRRNLA